VYICGLQWLIIIIIIIFFFFFFFWCRQQLSADLWGVLQRENNQTRRVCTYVSQATRMDQISEAMENWEKKKEE
jgi:ATP-dependent Zn protease